ncbi:MAG: hypothetical protein F6K24_11495 [Okeania sp. SIO2D1]|nr:hypothetical protein [Okeania sp. SIO2D1]
MEVELKIQQKLYHLPLAKFENEVIKVCVWKVFLLFVGDRRQPTPDPDRGGEETGGTGNVEEVGAGVLSLNFSAQLLHKMLVF